VSETAAINWMKRVEQTGSRAPAQLGGYNPMMLAPHQEFLEGVRRDEPDIALQGLCDRLAAKRGVKTHTSVTSRFLRHLGVTLKKRRSSRVSKIGLT
jgi:putative transposase